MKWIGILILFGVMVCGAGEIVVLTETPVDLFELPTGGVLTNAYAFKRSSAGMMIIHDGGAFWLNYKTLSPDWQLAYTGKVIAQPKPAAIQTQARIPVAELDGLPESVKTFVLSDKYSGELDDKILTARLLQSAIMKDVEQIVSLKKKLDQDYPYSAYAGEKSLLDLFETCKACKGSGRTTVECRTCFGTGACQTCGGDGEREVGISDDTIHCTKCRGTGSCPDCKGVGGHPRPCVTCRGKGRVFDRDKCVKELDVLMKSMEKTATGNRPATAGRN